MSSLGAPEIGFEKSQIDGQIHGRTNRVIGKTTAGIVSWANEYEHATESTQKSCCFSSTSD